MWIFITAAVIAGTILLMLYYTASLQRPRGETTEQIRLRLIEESKPGTPVEISPEDMERLRKESKSVQQ